MMSACAVPPYTASRSRGIEPYTRVVALGNSDELLAADDEAKSLGARIAARLREDILVGRLRAGTPLSQPQLSHQYGTSRMPVRDAVRQMMNEGLAISTPAGAVVAALTAEDIEDAFTLLAFAHGQAARRASLNATYAELTTLTDLQVAMAVAEGRGDLPEVVRLTWEFHRMINQVARAPKILAVIRTVAMSVPMSYLLDFPDDAAKLVGEKGLVLDAIKERDVDRAELLMRQHVLDAGSNVMGYFFERGLLSRATNSRSR